MSKYYNKEQLPKEPINIITDSIEHDFTIIKNIFIMFVLAIVSTILILTITNKIYPQPTFREVCEANNGTYIDNNGYGGDSCIYNK